MARSEGCEHMRELGAEVALGIADGEDRARVLEHVAECADCRRELERLSSVADELLVLGPEREPPAGFEVRVLREIRPRRERRRWLPDRRRWVRAWPAAAAALAAGLLTAGGLLLAFRDDRRIADHYRATLAQAHGTYFGAIRLHDAAGASAGAVFTYRGSPSWLVVTVAPAHRDAAAGAELVTGDGRRVRLRSFRLAGGAWGGALPIDLRTLAAVHVLARDGRPLLIAVVPRSDR